MTVMLFIFRINNHRGVIIFTASAPTYSCSFNISPGELVHIGSLVLMLAALATDFDIWGCF